MQVSVHELHLAEYEDEGDDDQSPHLTFNQFRLWLDLNPYVRTLFIEAFNPQMWMIDSKGTTQKLIANQGSLITVDWSS